MYSNISTHICVYARWSSITFISPFYRKLSCYSHKTCLFCYLTSLWTRWHIINYFHRMSIKLFYVTLIYLHKPLSFYLSYLSIVLIQQKSGNNNQIRLRFITINFSNKMKFPIVSIGTYSTWIKTNLHMLFGVWLL